MGRPKSVFVQACVCVCVLVQVDETGWHTHRKPYRLLTVQRYPQSLG